MQPRARETPPTNPLVRHGHGYDEPDGNDRRKDKRISAHWGRVHSIELGQAAARDAMDYNISEIRHLEARKKAVEKEIAECADQKMRKGCVGALRCLKSIEAMTALSLVVETGAFSRFDNARTCSSWIGLVPSEHSSGEKVARGGITKAGSSHLRKQLVESAWRYMWATREWKRSGWTRRCRFMPRTTQLKE